MTPRARFVPAALVFFTIASLQGQGPATGITSKDLLDGLANPSRWLTYSGDYTGQRFSPLAQITPANAAQLAPQWTFFEATGLNAAGQIVVTGRHPSFTGTRAVRIDP